MESKQEIKIKCRGIILHEDRLLVAKHIGTGFYALPGGHLKWPESPVECVEREIEEEFGVKPEVGKLLYINTFQYGYENKFLEFFFEVKNGKDYLGTKNLGGTHKDEILEILWVKRDTNLEILPKQFCQDFKEGKIFSNEVQFIS